MSLLQAEYAASKHNCRPVLYSRVPRFPLLGLAPFEAVQLAIPDQMHCLHAPTHAGGGWRGTIMEDCKEVITSADWGHWTASLACVYGPTSTPLKGYNQAMQCSLLPWHCHWHCQCMEGAVQATLLCCAGCTRLPVMSSVQVHRHLADDHKCGSGESTKLYQHRTACFALFA